MAIYIVGAREINAMLANAITREFPNDHFRFSDRIWFVRGTDTAKSTSERLGIKKEGITGAFVIAASPLYYGVANPALWDWLKTSFEKE
jgi:hypothetical protein